MIKNIEKSESTFYNSSKYSLNNIKVKNKYNSQINKSNTNSNKNTAKKENKLVSLKFIMSNNKKGETGVIVSCRKNNLFSDIIDKLMKTNKNLDRNKVKRFTIKNKENIVINQNKTIEENKIEDNSHIIINI